MKNQADAGEHLGVNVQLSFAPPPVQNIARVDATGTTGQNLRNFGYRNEVPTFSQHVINDSARVADWLSRGIR
jgi:hypothetical protein